MAFKPSKEDVDRGLSITAIAGVVTILVGASALLVGSEEFEAYKVLNATKDFAHEETERVAHVEIQKSLDNFDKIFETYMVTNTRNLNTWAVGNYSLLHDAVSEELLLLLDIENKTPEDKSKIIRLKMRLEKIEREIKGYKY